MSIEDFIKRTMPNIDFLKTNEKEGWRILQDIYEQVCYILKRFKTMDKIRDLPVDTNEDGKLVDLNGNPFLTTLDIEGKPKIDLGVVTTIDDIIKTGYYTYSKAENEDVQTLIVQNYPGRWLCQYQFTPNNINRRYLDYSTNLWSEWATISQDRYNPNFDYIANSKTIQQGIKDANKEGLFLGDRLNGDYIGFSESDIQDIYQEHLDKQLDELENATIHVDCKKPSGDAQWDISDPDYICVKTKYGNIKLTKNNAGYNTSYGYYVKGSNAIIFEPNQKVYIRIKGTMYYKDADISVNADLHSFKKQQPNVVTTVASVENVQYQVNDYFYIDSIEIIPTSIMDKHSRGKSSIGFHSYFEVHTSAGLLYTVNHDFAREIILVSNKIYNLGDIANRRNKDKYGLLVTHSLMYIYGQNAKLCATCSTTGIGNAILEITTEKCKIWELHLIVKNTSNTSGQQPALIVDTASSASFDNCTFISAQDTIWIRHGSTYFHKCNIEGTVDFICGGDEDKTKHLSIFDNCNLYLKSRSNSVICAPSGVILFYYCKILQNESYELDMNDKYYLARPWKNDSVAMFMTTRLCINSLGYTTMSEDAKFNSATGEENNMDLNLKPIDSYRTIDKSNPIYTKYNTLEKALYAFNNI
uniref:Pectinesterase n=1 Tax=Geladintestivirus 1 TaxID=3233133 RepID=A0AAU8MLS8_9CAUD